VEAELSARLEGVAKAAKSKDGSNKAVAVSSTSSPAEEAAVALEWMQRLALRSPRLWRACADNVELALQDRQFMRTQLPAAICALAALGSGAEESALGSALLSAAVDTAAMPKYSAEQVLDLFRAACLLRLTGNAGDAKAAVALLAPAARLASQLPLPGRRALLEAAETLGEDAGGEALAALKALPMAPLPALAGSDKEADWDSAEVGPQALLLPAGGGDADRRGVRLVGFGDMFAAPPPAATSGKTAVLEPSLTTPSCRLALRALELQGWKVELRS